MRQPQALAEEALKAMASAAAAVRLYPPTSDLPTQAVERFVSLVGRAAARGPLRFIVERDGFREGDAYVEGKQSQLASLAEALHSHQVGQLVVASGVSISETRAFLGAVALDPHALNQAGGLRAELKRLGVTRLLVIEITLLSSEAEGLAGLDLLSAPLSQIGPAVVDATATWTESLGGEGRDDVAQALTALEAAGDIAARRISDALLLLDERTRVAVVSAALSADTNGRPMEGMLRVLATMDPAALARLLRLAVGDYAAHAVAVRLELPPQVARALMLMLAPSPCSEREMGVPETVDPEHMAEEVATESLEDDLHLSRSVAHADPALAAGRVLRTTVALGERRRDEDAVLAIGHALPPALRAGAFPEVRGALSKLQCMSGDVALTAAVARARGHLADVDLLSEACEQACARRMPSDALAELLVAVGPSGAEALVATFTRSDEERRTRLAQTARFLGEGVAVAAGRVMRNADSENAMSLVSLLSTLGDKRVLPSLQLALAHLDVGVRRAGVSAVADLPGREARTALVRVLGHWDPSTRRFAVREIGRIRAEEALPALQRTLEDISPIGSDYELKKEAVMALEAIGTEKALPILHRVARRRLVLSRKNRELRFLARKAIDRLVAASPETTLGAEAS